MTVTRAVKASLDTPLGFEGHLSTHGATCGICCRIQDFKRPNCSKLWAGKWLRMAGWRYLPQWGWTCGDCLALRHGDGTPVVPLSEVPAEQLRPLSNRKKRKALKAEESKARRAAGSGFASVQQILPVFGKLIEPD